MEFSGCDKFMPNEPTIEIHRGEDVWDLHNAGEFIDFSYDVISRVLTLHWKYYRESEDGQQIQNVNLYFIRVVSFEVKGRDPEMPFSEDDCLSEMISYPADNCIVIRFMGGQEIMVASEEIRFCCEGT